MNESTNRDAAGTASEIRDKVRDTAADLASGAKQQARAQYDEKKDTAIGEIDSLAQALRRVGSEMRDQGRGGIAVSLAATAADKLESMSRSFEGKDLDGVIRDVESFGRRNPAVFLGAALATGFLISRFLKSSNPNRGFGDFEESGYGTSRYGSSMGSQRGDFAYGAGAGSGYSGAAGFDSGFDRNPSPYGGDAASQSYGSGSGLGATRSGAGSTGLTGPASSGLGDGTASGGAAGFSTGSDLDANVRELGGSSLDVPTYGSASDANSALPGTTDTTRGTTGGASGSNRGGNRSKTGGR